MYEWLAESLQGSGHVVTANRRLARVLAAHYGEQQVARGELAWRRPNIHSWHDWLVGLAAAAEPGKLPTLINQHQSRVLWERCLRREISDPLLNLKLLVRQARDAWARLFEFRVSLEECRENAAGRDQKLFARAASEYAAILSRENWVDESMLPEWVTEFLAAGGVEVPTRVTLAGFDRLSPEVTRMLEVLARQGCAWKPAATRERGEGVLEAFATPDAELCGAGNWARNTLFEDPGARIAIVVTNLERDAERSLRLVREGFSPGWQYAGKRHEHAVNLSYGRTLASYPACELALLLLRWLTSDLSSVEVGLLLRSPMLGSGEQNERSRLELQLRRLPDRGWTPAMLAAELGPRNEARDAGGWLERLEMLVKRRTALSGRRTPAAWGEFFDAVLSGFNWPGEAALDSAEFQVVNRWRELLNEFARLGLVTGELTAGEALGRLTGMVGETVFQPESEDGIVQLMGPLEAAGMEFDYLWISGLGTAQWPPQSKPSVLLARQLQRTHGMPDADPGDTLEYSRRVLSRLAASAPRLVCSYARSVDDGEQAATSLLTDFGLTAGEGGEEAIWHAAALVDAATAVPVEDRVPPLQPYEEVAGGAAVLQRQLEEPFSAFAIGRLGIRPLQPVAVGLAPWFRGNLVHDALRHLHRTLPSQADILSLDEAGMLAEAERAADKAFRGAHRNADAVLASLLRLEERRVTRLLISVMELDRGREPFSVAGTERALDAEIEGVPLRLRVDRIDRLPNREFVILDYKTGAQRRFRSGDGMPADMQLVVYACALDAAISDLGLVNIDSRGVNISGAGRTLTPELDWDAALAEWRAEVERAAREFRAGDVRLFNLQNIQSARPLALLSRIGELRLDG
jgi:probable DNA repair protein